MLKKCWHPNYKHGEGTGSIMGINSEKTINKGFFFLSISGVNPYLPNSKQTGDDSPLSEVPTRNNYETALLKKRKPS